MRSRPTPRYGIALLGALLALPLVAALASSCRHEGQPTAAKKGKATPSPVVRFTPPPRRPTPTLRPGQPTPLPDLPD
jgi:hypothetical protein